MPVQTSHRQTLLGTTLVLRVRVPVATLAIPAIVRSRKDAQVGVLPAYRLYVRSSPSAEPPVPAVRRCIISRIAPQVLPSPAAGANNNLCFVLCGTEQALDRALLLLCLFNVMRLVEIMLLPAWLIHLELQRTRQVPLQQVEDCAERFAKASKEAQSLKESGTSYQHYLEKELPERQKELLETINAIQIANNQLNSAGCLQSLLR